MTVKEAEYIREVCFRARWNGVYCEPIQVYAPDGHIITHEEEHEAYETIKNIPAEYIAI